MSVLLIDPLNTNIPTQGNDESNQPIFINGVPQYEDMHIYASLVVERRGRTVLETNTKGLKANLIRTGLESDVKINFLGFNQEKNSPDNGNFTTRYYDGSVSDGTQHDSFGITRIKTLINSSYIPQIDIEFTDVRGLTFFNNENSPYRILFDFPPPIFYLTIKGYYGKALQYQMHLVKYTTDFKSETGNYIINAKFIAITYAPLTDVLFKYVLNFGLMRRKDADVNLKNDVPKTTFELIQRLRNLFDNIKTKIDAGDQVLEYDNVINLQKKTDKAILLLNGYKNYFKKIYSNSNPILFVFETLEGENRNNIKVIQNLREYDSIIENEKKEGVSSNISKKLFIGFIGSVNFNEATSENILEIGENFNKLQFLKNYKKNLKNNINDLIVGLINDSDIGDPEIIQSKEYYNSSGELLPNDYNSAILRKIQDDKISSVAYVSMDITNLYLKLYERKTYLNEEKNILSGSINEQITELIKENLGMLPTIYNVFKIILDDVDHFFQIMRKTAIDAENHHNKYKNEILSGAGNTFEDYDEKLFPFPLILKQEKFCGGVKKVKTAPVNLSDKLPEFFPEITLVDDFIKSFLLYSEIATQFNIKSEIGSQGNVKWLPCNPLDTVLVNSQQNSPYFNIDNPLSGVVNVSEDQKFDEVLKIILNRFYVISQNTIRNTFYNEDINDEKKQIIKFYADAEAVNLASSILTQDYGNLLIQNFSKFKRDVNILYDYLNKNDAYSNIFSFNDNIPSLTISNSENLYVNRENSQFIGFSIVNPNIISIRNMDTTSENPVDEYMLEYTEKEKTFLKSLFFENVFDEFKGQYKFTETNLLYFTDGNNSKFHTKYVADNYRNLKAPFKEQLWSTNQKIFGGEYYTLFLKNIPQTRTRDDSDYEYTITEVINNTVNLGHKGLTKYSSFGSIEYLKDVNFANDIVKIWSISLTKFGNLIVNLNKFGNGTKDDIQNRFIRSIMYLSSFGWALSPFSRFPYEYNRHIFNNPAVNEMPDFMLAYMGALVGIEGTENYNNLLSMFSSPNNENELIDSNGFFIFSDIHDINTYLSEKDKETLKERYNSFMMSDFDLIDRETNIIYKSSISDFTCNEETNENKKYTCLVELFYNKLKDSNEIFRILMKKHALINYGQITFNSDYDDNQYYTPLIETNQNIDNKVANDEYFKNLINRVIQEIEERIENLDKKEVEFYRNVNDNDIYTQTYYSFKNINDKWLAGLNRNTFGYTFNNVGKNLIDQFAFVDRAMNPIGDTIINVEPLLDLEKDNKVSLFSVLNQLLSINGFEFFPLQNFISFENNEWEKSFKIDNGPIEKQFPTFVCMYIGGTSSYPTGINNEFKDDGITSLNDLKIPDFNSGDCEPNSDLDNQKENVNENFKFSEVKAFKVRFGQQNQSMFQDIQIDSKEYPETNESIQILSQIAGDGAEQSPVPKGQNLYNLYENRSYKATISGFGNAMIQPTQYFQLENVPLFNGAYVILEVEHNIVPNKMTTRFSGTKLLKYPIPRVTEPSAAFGFLGGGDSEVTQPTFENTLEGIGVASNPKKSKYNEFYHLKI